MSFSLSLTEDQIFTALRTYLLDILPAGTEVIRAQINRVSEPPTPDFVVMTPIRRPRLSTNVESGEIAPATNTKSVAEPTEYVIQLDVHGPASGDNMLIIQQLWRDDYTCQAFTALGVDMQPLFADDPREMPFENAEDQYEFRWVVDLHMQTNCAIIVPQQFADQVRVRGISAQTLPAIAPAGALLPLLTVPRFTG